MRKKRLSPETFNIPVEKIKNGFYTDKYFIRTREILLKDNIHKNVLMQVFSRGSGIVCGIDEAIAVLKLCSYNPEKIKIRALYDGDEIEEGQTVMTIEGDYTCFAHLETVYLGILSRSTSIATATKKIVNAARGKPVLFFPARYDYYLNQPSDGYSAYIAGAPSVSTDAQGSFWNAEGIGTMPHSLIAMYDGDTVKAAIAFDKYMPKDIKRIVLVDFENDCIKTSIEVAKHLGKRLYGVRFDTAENLIDYSLPQDIPEYRGVSKELCRKARQEFDRYGFDWIKIVVSSGFDEQKIKNFITENVPFDIVGIGSCILREKIDFTADIVMVEGKHCAKVGRKYNPNPLLEDA